MKKVLALVVVMAVALIGANSAFAAIAGSKHDMTSVNTVSVITGRHLSSCQYCHAPHNPTSQTVAPLWNRSTDSGAGLTTYVFYGTTTPAGTAGAQSLTCLTCHDGTLSITATAINQRGNAINTVSGTGNVDSAGKIIGTAKIGTDLSNDHPIGVVFGSSGYAGVATPNAPNAAGVATVGTGNVYRAYGASAAAAKVECSSCHDPHGDDYAANTVNSPFLRGSIETICSDCHTSK